MTRPLFLLTTIASLALANVAMAQDSAAPEAAPAPEAPAPNADLSVLDTGEAVNDAAQDDDTYVKSTHGDWAVQCLRVQEGEEPCQMYQLLKDQNGGNVAEVSIFRLNNGGQVAAGGTFVVPLETLLTEKLNVRVDSGQAKRYDFSFCTTVGCYARVGFTAEDVASFRRGSVANVVIVPALAPDQRVNVTMSLSGFTAAYDEISALEEQRQ
ncbi:invasion associated locus B family protein [Marivita sp.]|jgi:invasion protein IalB|uniref:invasion associated locus B family protein n=1 Tax=Marivita sp. TaxID=2003365 RepID=UPI003F6FF664